MITEDYVSFEIAKLLKEKGFECEKNSVTAMYNEIGKFHSLSTATDEYYYDYSDFDEYDYVAPTLQMAMKWLREAHNIIPVILVGGYTVVPFYYWFRIDKINDGRWEDSVYRDETERNTYEDACEAAIKYCLEKLI